MRPVWCGRTCGLGIFLIIAALVGGGLGWVTAAALRLEHEQLEARAQHEYAARLHLALWRLDGRIAPVMAREDSRPYNHYSAVFAPSVMLRPDGQALDHGTVLAPSPLLNADIPDWLLLHFQIDEKSNRWQSPQVPAGALRRRLADPRSRVSLANVTDARRLLLDELEKTFAPRTLLAGTRASAAEPHVRDTTLVPLRDLWENNDPLAPGQSGPLMQERQAIQSNAKPEYFNRFQQKSRVQMEVNPQRLNDARDVALNNLINWNGANWFLTSPRVPIRADPVDVHLSPLVPLWLATDSSQPRLMLTRLVKIEQEEVCQGIVLDWPRLQQLLAAEVADLFPQAELEPALPGTPADPERTMSTLHAQLIPGSTPEASVVEGWTPLWVGLALAWTAALVALAAVGLGGRALLRLSERRIRFVSAVTHELRTPLTTLRLYLDMLTGGLVREETQKQEYLHTLNAEAERLNRLISNVLDFSRLENTRPRLQKSVVRPDELLEAVQSTWQGRCHDAGKELIVASTVSTDAVLETDFGLVQQVLGNLLDNACKHSQGAADRRIWLRADGTDRFLTLEVEDCGPGVAPRERRSIFRPFRRGGGTSVTTGGVGLGLALAQRWTRLLGGRLTLHGGAPTRGACFRLELPLLKKTSLSGNPRL
jgi:signal transduction histidine kinase